MKRLLALVLCLLALFSLAACGSSESSDGKESNSSKSKAPKITFEEITVVDNDECTIKITGIDPSNFWGYTLNAYLENKSADKTYMYSITDASVNGIENDPLFATDVAPGKKGNADISFSDSTIEDLGLDYTDIELSFKVYDSDDWSADPVAVETVHVYPYGEDKAVQYVREAQPTDTVIADNEYVTAIITGFSEDEIWGYTANVFVVNKTETEVMFSVDETSVNGYMADPFWATSVQPGKCAYSGISWSDSTLEDNGITEIEEIEFVFKAYDFGSDDFVNERVTLQP